MMESLKLFILFSLFSFSFSSDILPRPLIIEYQEFIDPQLKELAEEVRLQCTSWRFLVESNNLSPWKTIPEECVDYVKEYIMGRAYRIDLERVSNEAGVYAKSAELSGDGKDAWVFDVDETLLSNLPYYSDHGYGLEIFDGVEFDKWVEKGAAPPIESSLKLYEDVLSLRFKVFFLTGRSEKQRNVTVQNLIDAGFQYWDKLILRGSEDHGKVATVYKSEKRNEMVEEGFRIVGATYWVLPLPFAPSNLQIQCIISHNLVGNGNTLLFDKSNSIQLEPGAWRYITSSYDREKC